MANTENKKLGLFQSLSALIKDNIAAERAEYQARAANAGKPQSIDEFIVRELTNQNTNIPLNIGTESTQNQPSLESNISNVLGNKSPILKNYLSKKFGISDTEEMPKDASGNYLTGNEYLATLNPMQQRLVKGLTEYSLDPAKAFSSRGQNREKYLAMASQYDPTFNMTNYDTRKNFLNDWSVKNRSKNITSFNTAIEHMLPLYESASETPSSSIKQLEQLQRWYAENLNATGKENLGMTKEKIALNAISGELANIFKQSGATDQEIEGWKNAYDPNAPTEAKKLYVIKGLDLMQSRLNALGSDYERVMGKPYQGEIVSKKAQKIIDKINSENTGKKETTQPKNPSTKSIKDRIEEARREGHSDEVILEYLSSRGL